MKILRGTIAGGVAFFFLGWLVWGILLSGYMEANYNDCMNRPGGEMVWWALILANLILGLFVTLFLKWFGAKSLTDGVKIGALFGLLLSLSNDLSFYSMSTMYNNFGALILDLIVYTVLMAVVGLIIVLLWGKGKNS